MRHAPDMADVYFAAMATIKDSISAAIRFWEPMRVVYNLVLAAIVGLHFWSGLPASKEYLAPDFVLVLFLLAVAANICYCAAYVPDVFAQLSEFRDAWRYARWVVFAVGTLVAAIITHFMSMSMFSRQ